jgi:hypothetical protein
VPDLSFDPPHADLLIISRSSKKVKHKHDLLIFVFFVYLLHSKRMITKPEQEDPLTQNRRNDEKLRFFALVSVLDRQCQQYT